MESSTCMGNTISVYDFLQSEVCDTAQRMVKKKWRIMIVDDEPDIHTATRFALGGVKFEDRRIEWISAYSAKEAKVLLEHEKDIAVLFLDVVMESDMAGLEFARWYREENIDPCTRIIIRTGQPGQMPEKQVIVDYDLHDYKTKTDFTADRLYTTTITALRSYRDMCRLKESTRELEKVIHASSDIMQKRSLNDYIAEALGRMQSIIGQGCKTLIAVRTMGGDWKISNSINMNPEDAGQYLNDMDELMKEESVRNGNCFVRRLSGNQNREYAIAAFSEQNFEEFQLDVLELYCNSVSIGLKNILLYDSVMQANKVTVMSLAQITEGRDKDTGEHVFRIAELSEKLGNRLLEKGIYPNKITEEMVSYLGLSSTLHDLGKIGISDSILLKPGKLTSDEFEIIKTHTLVGADILKSILEMSEEKIPYLEMGKSIAMYHHEHWDGKGYPKRLAGEEIPVEARVVAIVDVFDALTNQRCYKPAFSVEEALEIIRQGRGTHFDPVICDEFLEIVGSEKLV